MHPVGQAHALEQVTRAFLDGVVGGRFAGQHGHEDILKHRAVRQQVVRLEHEADAFASESRERCLIEGGQGDTINEHSAFVGLVQGSDQVEEGALAGAGGSHDGDGLACGDGEGGIAED